MNPNSYWGEIEKGELQLWAETSPQIGQAFHKLLLGPGQVWWPWAPPAVEQLLSLCLEQGEGHNCSQTGHIRQSVQVSSVVIFKYLSYVLKNKYKYSLPNLNLISHRWPVGFNLTSRVEWTALVSLGWLACQEELGAQQLGSNRILPEPEWAGTTTL